MSEIKYRVWSKKQKTYVYKHPFNKPGDFYITQNGVLFSDYGNAITPEVKQDNFIIEQSTDIKDKNGKMIHVGDIVKMKYPYDKRCIGKFVVVRDPNSPRIGLLDETKTDEIFDLYNHMSNHYEVIGDIHKNPELLNKDQPNEEERF